MLFIIDKHSNKSNDEYWTILPIMFNLISKSFLIITIITSNLLLLSCAEQPVKLNLANRDEIKKAENIVVISQRTDFPSMTTSPDTTAAELSLDLPDDWPIGKKLFHRYNIEDPNLLIKNKFLSRIDNDTEKKRFINIKKIHNAKESSSRKLRAKYISGYLLKFSPILWEIKHLPHDLTRYEMRLKTRARLIRIEDSYTIWSSTCNSQKEFGEPSPTLQQFLTENNHILEYWVDKATNRCAIQFMSSFHRKH